MCYSLTMYAFSILIIPCFLTFYIFAFKEFRAKSFIVPLAIGLLTGCIFCFMKEFFFMPSHIWTDSFLDSFFYIFFNDAFAAPIIFAIWLLACIKIDRMEYKISMFLPLVLAFYAAYIPYDVFTNRFNTSVFIIFFKPLLYIFMCWDIQVLICAGYKKRLAGKKAAAIFYYCICLVPLVLPSFAETLWTLNSASLLPYAIEIAMALFAVIDYMTFQKKPLVEKE